MAQHATPQSHSLRSSKSAPKKKPAAPKAEGRGTGTRSYGLDAQESEIAAEGGVTRGFQEDSEFRLYEDAGMTFSNPEVDLDQYESNLTGGGFSADEQQMYRSSSSSATEGKEVEEGLFATSDAAEVELDGMSDDDDSLSFHNIDLREDSVAGISEFAVHQLHPEEEEPAKKRESIGRKPAH